MRKTQRNRIRAAGAFFANDTHVLAGYQPHKSPPFISGIGGIRMSGESILHCALRETVEELLEIQHVPEELLRRLTHKLPERPVIRHQGFAMILYTFADLEVLLRTVSSFGLGSALYEDGVPHCLMDLLFHRRIPEDTDAQPEISQLCLLPLVRHPRDVPFVVPYFVEELARILEERKRQK